MASTLGIESIGFYDAHVDNEFKLQLIDVQERVLDLHEQFEGTGHASLALTTCRFDHLKAVADYAKDVAAQSGIDVDQTVLIEGEYVPVYDFSVPTYAAFEAEATTIKAVFDAGPDFLTTYPILSDGWAQHDFNVAANVGDAAKWFASKLLAALGIKEAYAGFLVALEATAGGLLKALGRAIRNRNLKKVIKLIIKIIKVIAGKKFRQKLIQEVGEAAAKKIIGKILAKAVPFIGWIFLALALAWALLEEIF